VRKFADLRLLGCVTLALAATASAQDPQPQVPPMKNPPSYITPRVPLQPAPPILIPRNVSEEDAAAYRKARGEYDDCRKSHDSGMRLTEAANSVILTRDKREFWEGELKNNSSMRLSYPGGYDQLLAAAFKEYQRLGGPATSVAAVRPIAPPCVRPAEPTGPKVPITDTKRLPTQ
jgi:hypothetical protein